MINQLILIKKWTIDFNSYHSVLIWKLISPGYCNTINSHFQLKRNFPLKSEVHYAKQFYQKFADFNPISNHVAREARAAFILGRSRRLASPACKQSFAKESKSRKTYHDKSFPLRLKVNAVDCAYHYLVRESWILF